MRSKLALVLIFLTYLFAFRYYSNYHGMLKGGGDCWGYYVYLPSAFIYHDLGDLKLTLAKRAELKPESVVRKDDGSFQIEEAHACGESIVIKYTYGTALLYAPFFFASHFYCTITHLYPADGFSLPFSFAIALSTLLYACLGLWILRKLLLRYFSDTLTGITLLVIALGTHLFYFSVLNSGMAHPYLFCLYALLLLATDSYYTTGKPGYMLLIGLSCGLITLIRPDEIIALSIPLLWDVGTLAELRARFQFLLSRSLQIAQALLIAALVIFPQLLYWKHLSGHWLYYSYTQEGFDFLHPHLREGLFGFANGWLSYTPIMFFAVIGSFFLPRYFRKGAWATYFFVLLHVYLIYSWWCWQYINGFGSRPMIETYPLLAFSLASFLYTIRNKVLLKGLTYLLFLFFSFLNLFQTWQFGQGLIWTEDANRAFYRSMFLKTHSDHNSLIAYDCAQEQPDEKKLPVSRLIAEKQFRDPASEHLPLRLLSGKTEAILINADSSGVPPLAWLKLSCHIRCETLEPNRYRQAVLVAEFFHKGRSIRWHALRLQNKIGNRENSIWYPGEQGRWADVSFYCKTPHRFTDKDDVLHVFLWNPSDHAIDVDELRVEYRTAN